MSGRSLLIATITTVAQAMAAPALQAEGTRAIYSAEYDPDHTTQVVYKSIDSSGKITYSTRRSPDAVRCEKITLKQAPSTGTIDQSRQRYEKLSEGAAALAQARLKRQAEREAEERKRLERLALLRSARPQVIEKKVVIGWNPLWHHYPGVHHRHASRKHPSRPTGNTGYRTTHKFGGLW